MGWRDVHIGPRDDGARIDGVEVWRHEWRWLGGKTVMLPHPWESNKILSYMICEAGTYRTVRFAAADLGDRLWAFYVPS